jgi:hypothetical protein
MAGSSSSSSLARQPCKGPGLLQKLPPFLTIYLKQVHPAVAFSDLVTIYSLRGGVVSPTPNPQPGGPGLRICPPETGWPSYTPRHWVSLSVASYDTKGCGGVILRAHTETMAR